MSHCHCVRRETALGWLVKTAVREALKLIRREGREVSLDTMADPAGEASLLRLASQPLEEVVDRRARLEEVAVLPARQQRVLWLRAVGLSYAEIAAHEGYTLRTVERQLLRAQRTVRG